MVQQGKLWTLQTQTAATSPIAALKTSIELVEENILTKKDAVSRFDPSNITKLLHPRLPDDHQLPLVGRGMAASPGAAVGKVTFSSDECVRLSNKGEKVILVLNQTSAEDIYAMGVAAGVLTSEGGMSSHASVITRGMGKPCIVGCKELQISKNDGIVTLGGTRLEEGQFITIDSSTGEIFNGYAKIEDTKFPEKLKTLLMWADGLRHLKIMANADHVKDAKLANVFGAEGIGLCRTEHMFFDKERLPIMQAMILANTRQARREAIHKIASFQKNDFLAILETIEDRPFTVRLLDPPLHEFLPTKKEEIITLAKKLNSNFEEIETKINSLHENNPMLGHRGCRLGITMHEIYETQIQALFEAAAHLVIKGNKPQVEIMVPFVAFEEEMKQMRLLIDQKAQEINLKNNIQLPYAVGTMIEIPQAALQADKLAHHVDFMSFGTNDLTQLTLGISRDDASSFMKTYIKTGILEKDPFITLEKSGVKELIELACQRARKIKPGLKLGVCGEQAADPSSINFFHEMGLSYVSCSPYRIPIARLAAGQASLIKEK